MKNKKRLYKLLLLCLLFRIAAVNAQTSATLVQAGDFVASAKIANGFGIQTSSGYVRITAFKPDVVRVRLTKAKDDSVKRMSFAVIAPPQSDLTIQKDNGDQL